MHHPCVPTYSTTTCTHLGVALRVVTNAMWWERIDLILIDGRWIHTPPDARVCMHCLCWF